MTEGKVCVVIADDEGHIRTLIGTVLRSLSYELAGEAANGNEAVELVRKFNPDLVLLDINMPMKTGVEALKEIVEIAPDACIIMLTSIADIATVQECIDLGAANYIRKDTPLRDMRTMIGSTWAEFNEQ